MNIISFFVYLVIVTFTPGPANIVILSITHNFGTKKAMEYVYGATVAFSILLTLSAVLNNVLVSIVPRILMVMQIIGCLYMLYLAYQIYKMDSSKVIVQRTTTFMSGFLMQFVNPKVVLFSMTVIPTFVMPYYTTLPALAISVVFIIMIGFSAFVTWVLFGTMFKEFLQRYQKTVNIIMALFLVYSAIMVSGIVSLFKG